MILTLTKTATSNYGSSDYKDCEAIPRWHRQGYLCVAEPTNKGINLRTGFSSGPQNMNDWRAEKELMKKLKYKV